MIRGAWRAPNFRFRAQDRGGNVYEAVAYADAEAALLQRLRERGYINASVEPFDFKSWLARAASIERELAAAGSREDRKRILERAPIWQELKWHLFELFHGKCAYCEWKPIAGSSGDVEHYRPKKSVFEDAGHPGYFWLAYDPSNLLPCCELCNRARAKRTQFPVAAGTRARSAEALSLEAPLLLNPYEKDFEPLQHLSFRLGIATGITERGKRSVKVLNLNRAGLFEERREAQKNVEQDWDVGALRHGFDATLRELEEELMSGIREYSAALLDELRRVVRERIAVLQRHAG